MSGGVRRVLTYPPRAGRRTWRRFRRRTAATQLRTAGVAVAVLAGVVAWVVVAPSPSSSTVPVAGPARSQSAQSLLDSASTSTRGIVGNRINVVFPVVALNSLAGEEGFSEDIEYAQQDQAIHVFVNDINDRGGINGRRINPIIVSYNPEDQAEMEALCKDWTEGSPAAFAVVDGLGTYEGAPDLCVTQQGHTPMITQYTTVSAYTTAGAPYLWWTGVSQTTMLQALVQWGRSAGLLHKKVGIIVGDDASDQEALHQVLLPDLERAGVHHPLTVTIAADPTETSETDTEAPLAIQRLRSAGVTSVIPLIPFDVFFPVLQAETQQHYFPRLLLSDYDSSIQDALGLIPVPYEQALNGQEGVTTLTLGGVDDNRPASQGGYDAGARSCYESWIKVYPKPAKGQPDTFIEEQGPIVSWCQAIRLFAAAAEKAGPDLNRRTFVQAMATIRDFPGTLSPVLSYKPGKYDGPTQYQVVKLHNNVPPSPACKILPTGKAQGTCWVVVQGWRPLPGS